jgi:hypothetical protein
MKTIARYTNQVLTLERLISHDARGVPTYSSPEQIRARYERKDGLQQTIAGESAEAESYVLTETEVALGDLIEGNEVRRVEPKPLKNGTILCYEVFL